MNNGSTWPRIYIAYSHEDAEFVVWLAAALKSLGHNIWLDRSDILAGDQALDQMHRALEKSRIMLLVVTPQAMRSHLVKSQWMYFLNEGEKKLIPLMLKPLTPPDTINFMLASLQHINFYREEVELALNMLHHSLIELYSTLDPEQPQRPGEDIPLTYHTPARHFTEEGLSADEAGIAGVHLTMPMKAFSAWLHEAHSTVRVLNTWTGVFVKDAGPLVQAVQRGARVQILLLDPSSPFARQRSRDLNFDAAGEEVPNNIRASIRQVAYLHAELGPLAHLLELRLYNLLPPFSLHQCDQRALLGLYATSSRTTAFPMLELEINAQFGAHIDAEFRHIWDHATPVDLSLNVAPEVEAANDLLPDPLSARELEILSLISAGLSNQEIADRLVVTLATVKKHINNLYSKLGVDSRTRAMIRAQEMGLMQ